MRPATLIGLQRYPVKGFSAEPLDEMTLERGAFFPGDRIYAVENGPSGFDPSAPAYKPKTSFLVLMRHARLAALRTRFDSVGHVFHIDAGSQAVAGDLRTPDGRAAVEAFLTSYMSEEARGPLKVLAAPSGHRFTDSLRAGFVSLLNLASVRDLEARMGTAIDPARFRMNLHLDGWEPGAELDLVGRTLGLGTARLKILKRTERCAATSVHPVSGLRDLNVVKGLALAYGHTDCGVYAQVETGGRLAVGDAVRLLD